MKLRHVIDESGLHLGECSQDEMCEVLEEFLALLDRARDRDEPVASTTELFCASVTDDLQLYDLLYVDGRSPIKDRDLRRRLKIAVDRVPYWEEDEELMALVADLEVRIAGDRVFAPSLGLAHACRGLSRALGCLNLYSSGRSGRVAVEVNGQAHELHFVVDDDTQRALFRDRVEIERMNEDAFADNAMSAFPDLRWGEELWSGLGNFERPYGEHRRTLVRHLGVLDDEGAGLFDEWMSSHPEEIGPRLGALGVVASDENGRTKRDKQARRARTRRFEGEELVFWWHTKLLPHIDRVHFLWRPGGEGDSGEIIVGLFTDHCYIPE